MDFHAAKSALEHEELFPALEFTPADSSVTKELAAASGFKDIAGNKNEHSKKPTALATPYASVLKATKPKAPKSQGVRQGSTSQGIQMSAVSETPPPETTQSDLQLSTVRQRRQVREADAKPSNSIRATPAVSVRAARHGGRNTHLTCPSILQWNARGLRRRLPDLRQHLIHSPADVLAIQEPMTRPGDFRRTTARGRSLECVTSSLHLEALNDGTETYVRRGVNDSVLDLSFAPPDVAANWTPQPDSWGSDHIPINIVSPNASKPKYRRCRVTNWDMYRRHLDSALAAGPLKDPIIAIANALSLSTRTIKVPLWRPAPDLVYLNLRAARRRAQRKARRTKDPKDWNTHHKIDAKFRRHTLRLQRKQWGQLCASFGSPGGLSKAWKIAKALSSAKHIQHPISGLAVALQKPLQETVELLADEFSKAIPLPPGYQEPETRPSDACAPMQLDNDFTRGELEYALRRCTKRSAPGPDGVTYQALRNLDKSHHPALLEALNKRLVLRRLTWQLGTNKTLPDQLSGFRTHRSTVDAIGEVATSFEEARAAGKTMYCAFLDIHKAFDALPHATILHQLTLFGIADALERFHRVALRLCLGLPPYAKNVATLTEAQEEPIILREERVAMHSLVRMHTTPSAQYILANLLKRPSSHLGQLAAQFQRNIGSPGVLYSSRPPHSTRPPLDVRETLPDLPRKKDIHPTVARTAVAVALENEYVEHLEVYTDGSVDKKRGTATAAYTIPAISTESAVLLNIETSSTTAETVAILLALTALQERPAIGKAVILTDSRSALVHIANPEHAPLIAQEAAHIATKLEDNAEFLEMNVQIPWQQGHIASRLPRTTCDSFHEARLHIARDLRKRHPDPGTANGEGPVPVPTSKLTRKDATLLHRLRTNSAFTRKTLHRFGRTSQRSSADCTACGEVEDIDHILWHCPEYEKARKTLLASVRATGAQVSTTEELLFPTGGKQRARVIFRAVLEFAHVTEISDRL
ncbi:hypothetical protein HPB47_026147 [Ixodes persulcatus]|uniref:Uncharacterized protein n=1 Tax=Ixodes persulcatus TaxID=34615 RepID=A0AC60Q1X4_IXOPE|nr:hypothetical protein HPB47_026147 [Ixodes persulcatus]